MQPSADTVSGTDSDTESSFGEDICYDAPEFQGLTLVQISEKIWWGYAHAKSKWRKHMLKPARRGKRNGGGKRTERQEEKPDWTRWNRYDLFHL